MYSFCSRDEFLKRLGIYVNMDTPSGDYERMQLLNAQLEKDLAAAGAAVKRIEAAGGDVTVAEVGSGAHRVLLLGHKDTVFAQGGAEKNPFRMELRDGKQVLRGPGVLDMKSGVCMMIELMRHFAANPIADWRITAIFNSDEEIGSGESSAAIYEYLDASDYCLSFEPSIAEHCTVARKGIAAFAITAYGVSAHSGSNYLAGASAIEGLSRVIAQIYDLRDDAHGLSVNVGVLQADGKRNIIADKARAEGEVRCYEQYRMEQAIEKIRGICEQCPVANVRCEVESLSSRPAMEQSAASKKLFELAAACAAKHDMRLIGRATGGGGDPRCGWPWG